jgi:hypothetical protein
LRQQTVILKDESDLLVAECGHRRLAQLERVLLVERDRPRSRRLQRADYIEQRAFAAARRAHDRRGVAALECQIDVGKDRQRASRRRVFFGQVGEFEQLLIVSFKEHREWGVGNREWGIGKLFPIPHSPLPIPDSPLP